MAQYEPWLAHLRGKIRYKGAMYQHQFDTAAANIFYQIRARGEKVPSPEALERVADTLRGANNSRTKAYETLREALVRERARYIQRMRNDRPRLDAAHLANVKRFEALPEEREKLRKAALDAQTAASWFAPSPYNTAVWPVKDGKARWLPALPEEPLIPWTADAKDDARINWLSFSWGPFSVQAFDTLLDLRVHDADEKGIAVPDVAYIDALTKWSRSLKDEQRAVLDWWSHGGDAFCSGSRALSEQRNPRKHWRACSPISARISSSRTQAR